MKTAGEILKECRKYRGVSQTDLARRSGVSHPTISMVENGRKNPSWATFTALLDALGYQVKVIPKEVEK